MKKIILIAVLSLGFAFVSCKSEKKEVKTEQTEIHKEENSEKVAYLCPMDCEKGKTYDKEGKCPVCEMKLVNKDSLKKDEDHKGHKH